jgi:transposase
VKAGQSVAKVQVGPNAQALALALRFEQRVPLAGISAFLATWFNLRISPGGLSQIFTRLGRHSQESYKQIERHVQSAEVLGVDETGIRQDGLAGYVWIARTDKASLFRIELSRGGWVIDSMLGEGFDGIVASDFYVVYTGHDDWFHAYCGGHLIREAKKIAELDPCRETEEFRDRLREAYIIGKEAQTSGDLSARLGVRIRFGRLIADNEIRKHPEVARLQGRMHEHFHGLLTFIDRPDIPADNNATERDLRFFASYRKVTGGTRSAVGSQTLAHWISVTQTLRKNALPLRDYVIGLYKAHLNGQAPPSIFAN